MGGEMILELEPGPNCQCMNIWAPLRHRKTLGCGQGERDAVGHWARQAAEVQSSLAHSLSS